MASSVNNRRYFPSSPSQTSFLSNQQPTPQNTYERGSNESYSSSSRLSSNSQASFARSGSSKSINTVPRTRQTPSVVPSLSDKFSLSADPAAWGAPISANYAEPDDALHEVTKRDRINNRGTIFTTRGIVNLGCILLLTVCLVTLFAGYPLISFLTRTTLSTLGGFNIGGINSTGQIPSMSGNWGLIDVDTPPEALTITAFSDGGKEYELVFSDEFNTDGRSFYPGDDPYWEAVDLHYWQTGNLEWYDPAALNTSGGSLHVTLSAKQTHELDYQGGMMSTWNKFCFTGGLILTSVRLPGDPTKHGLWPAVWTMGNLGRAGYGASLEGMWPYTYDSCDVGTVKNQSVSGSPYAATINGDPYNNDAFSYLPGQRLSRCTCPGESHPGPVHAEDNSYVGRSAPEIDIFEATVGNNLGMVSQSAQFAPFDAGYHWFNTSEYQIIANPDITSHNNYEGGAYQMAVSGITQTDQNCYETGGTGCYSVYGFEYQPGFDGYITWISDNKIAWTMKAGAVGPDKDVEIDARPIPQEPMYIITNLGMSTAFGGLDTSILTFPSTMSIDWIRVYQPKDKKNIGCDPPDFPTQAYINQYMDAYTNPNFTIWGVGQGGYNQTFPKNKFLGQC